MPRALSLLALALTACAPTGLAPTADAGARVTGDPGEVYLFDASASSGEGLRYTWTLLDGPADAELYDADSDAAYLIPYAEGEYLLAVEACDRWGRCDVAETVALVGEVAQRAGAARFGAASLGGSALGAQKPRGENQAPEAAATSARVGGTLGRVKLDGSASSDPDDDALRFRWQLVSRPAGSALSDGDIRGGSTATASFAADVRGQYVFSLTVRDNALADSVTLPGMRLSAVDDDYMLDVVHDGGIID